MEGRDEAQKTQKHPWEGQTSMIKPESHKHKRALHWESHTGTFRIQAHALTDDYAGWTHSWFLPDNIHCWDKEQQHLETASRGAQLRTLTGKCCAPSTMLLFSLQDVLLKRGPTGKAHGCSPASTMGKNSHWLPCICHLLFLRVPKQLILGGTWMQMI